MPRVARKNSISNFYHIIVKGINKEYIFGKEKYIQEYLKIMQMKLQTSNINILAYCIMNNHAHLLIFSKKCEDLGKYMQRLNTAYSIFYNKINKREGYVFKNRYYSQEILNQQHLQSCLRYIHNNPVKAKIVKSMEEYKYSSYNEFLNKKTIISSESIKILFGIDENFEEQFKLIHKEINNDNYIFDDIKNKTIEEFINEIEEKYKIETIEIKSNKTILKEIIKKARKETNATLVELSKVLKLSKSTVAKYDKG